jgi:hypothetical protein
MDFKVGKYRRNKKVLEDMLIQYPNRSLGRVLADAVSATDCHYIAMYHFLGEIKGAETVETELKQMLKFYGFDAVTE